MTAPNAIVKVGSVAIGNALPLTIIAGPCQLESRAHGLEMASALKEMAAKAGVGLVYKTSFDKANRTSTAGQRGLGLEASLPIFVEIRESLGLPILTDIHEREQCAIVAGVVDVLQIPAFLSRQTDLIAAAAKTGKVVNIKKGQFLAPWDMKNAIAKVTECGNPNVLVTERGASFGYNTLVVDMTALPEMAKFGAPVVMDATHAVQKPGGQGTSSGGNREMAPYIARAAVAAGVAAVFMETHEDPDRATKEGRSDGPNMLWLKDIPAILADLIAIDRIVKKRPSSQA
jgi:2-dehydro-3-deoxyphosphooctonate aldolase (KDO 8-P synthase)